MYFSKRGMVKLSFSSQDYALSTLGDYISPVLLFVSHHL